MNPSTSLTTFNKKKGGFRACMFVFVLGALENIGFVANTSFMVLYFSMVMHFNISTAANALTNFLGSTADHNPTIQAYSKSLQPDPCTESTCIKGRQALMLYTSLCLQALGAGGVKGSIAALGADQFDHKDQKGSQGLASYLNYYQFSATIGSIIGVTGVAWVPMNKDWFWGFFIGLVAALIGFVVLALGKPFYCFQPLANSPILRVSQVNLYSCLPSSLSCIV
ncbi:Protein NRT1/ PTR FAMILY 4.6 [Olea europaea subsp. europaea]|uniref:Protein NRT1/ PTR FAMILY 4.6 n=1 Tax=Olea europaea subsp. europaea TaxID=158383 RepID=A0A8S0QS30_OLEEU|nr:Protein NRT1/ PTR FAMILY 4.6 [Olea europaea subsp. europaea]